MHKTRAYLKQYKKSRSSLLARGPLTYEEGARGKVNIEVWKLD